MKKLIATIFAVLTIGSAQAGSVAGTGGSTEFTQILNNFELIGQVINSTVQIQNEIAMIQQMAVQAKRLTSGQWGTVVNDLLRLKNNFTQGQQISYVAGNQDALFKQMYPSYSPTQNYSQLQSQWSQAQRDSVQNSMSAAGMTVNSVQSDADLLTQLQQTSQNADGQMAAIQAGNQMSGMVAQQLLQLRSLTATQMQTQASFQAAQAAQLSRQSASDGADKAFWDTSTYIPYDPNAPR